MHPLTPQLREPKEVTLLALGDVSRRRSRRSRTDGPNPERRNQHFDATEMLRERGRPFRRTAKPKADAVS